MEDQYLCAADFRVVRGGRYIFLCIAACFTWHIINYYIKNNRNCIITYILKPSVRNLIWCFSLPSLSLPYEVSFSQTSTKTKKVGTTHTHTHAGLAHFLFDYRYESFASIFSWSWKAVEPYYSSTQKTDQESIRELIKNCTNKWMDINRINYHLSIWWLISVFPH